MKPEERARETWRAIQNEPLGGPLEFIASAIRSAIADEREAAEKRGRIAGLNLALNVVGGEALAVEFGGEDPIRIGARVQIELRKILSKETGSDENVRAQAELDGAAAIRARKGD